MGHSKRRIATALLLIGLAPTALSPAFAESRRHAALIVDGNSGRVLSEASADEPRHPASLTKMMTLYVVFELIEQKKLSYDTLITFSDAATHVQPTKLSVAAGGTITVLEAAKALITKSANDASIALAEHIAGTEPQFAALMTRTARRIGMKSSTFKNAHGLHDSGQVTTARDMVTLGLKLQDDFPKHYALFATRDFTFRGDTHRNHNTMLAHYEGTDGIKTGYIGASGFNLVANVKRGDKHVIGVVFGGATAGARNNTMKSLLNVALLKASSQKTRNSQPIARSLAPKTPSPVEVARPSTPPVAIPEQTVAVLRVQPVPLQRPLQQATSRAPEVQASIPQPMTLGARTNAPAPAAMNGNGIHIQVGAFASKAEADRQILEVQRQAGTLLANFPTKTIEAVSNGKTVFRARFVQVEASSAGNICNALRRQNIDCLVTRPE